MRDYAIVSEVLASELNAPAFLTSDLSLEEARRWALQNSVFKKLSPLRKVSADLTEKAVLKFKAINRQLASDFEWVSDNIAEETFFDLFKDHLNCALGVYSDNPLDHATLGQLMQTGPGASQKADSTDWHSKLFESPLSYVHEELIRVYRGALAETGVWAEAEMARSEKYGFVKVAGGKYFCVLKNADEARSCCTEPGLEGLIQLGVGNYLVQRCKLYFGIDIPRQQAVNRRLASRGSWDQSIGTVDLTSASDSNSLSLFEKVVRPSFLKWVMLRSRCEVVVLPNGDIERLNMISTMGNGFTFPYMTIVLASAVRAALDILDPGAEFSVFGDDIVVPTRAYEFLLKMLRKLGYTPNAAKSYGVGPFRESCGHDYFRGSQIRGVYIRSLETSADVYSAFNRLARWSAITGIRITKTLKLLKSMAHDFRVPPSEDDLSGFKVPFVLTKPKVTSEYWFKYRCLKRRSRVRVLSEVSPEKRELDPCAGEQVSFLAAGLHGTFKHAHNGKTGESFQFGRLESSIRDPIGSVPRMKVVTKSIPYWDYVSPESEPGESWLPDKPAKRLSKYDLTPWCLHESGAFGSWAAAVVDAFAVSDA